MLFHQLKKSFRLWFVFSIPIILMIFHSAFGFVVNASEPENNNYVVEPFGRPMISVILDGDYRGNRTAAEIAAKYGITVAFAPQGRVSGELSAMGTDFYREMQESGHEILMHGQRIFQEGYTYPDWDGSEEGAFSLMERYYTHFKYDLGLDVKGFVGSHGRVDEQFMRGIYTYFDYGFTLPNGKDTPVHSYDSVSNDPYHIWRLSMDSTIENIRATLEDITERQDDNRYGAIVFYQHARAEGDAGTLLDMENFEAKCSLIGEFLSNPDLNVSCVQPSELAYGYFSDTSVGIGHRDTSDENSYTLRFDSRGGDIVSGDETYSVQSGAILSSVMSTLPTVTREGFEFAGWFEGRNEVTSVEQPFDYNNGMTFYAKWQPTTHYVVLDLGGGYGCPMGVYKEDARVLYLGDHRPYKEGSSFLGWTSQAGSDAVEYPAGGGVLFDNSVDTLYAVWKGTFTLTFDPNGGELVSGERSYSIMKGQSFADVIAAFPVAERTGYKFSGFFDAEGTRYSTKSYVFNGDEDLTLYAQWTPTTHKVYFDANGGTGGSTQKTKVYDTPLLLNNILPTRAGFEFVGWASDPNAYRVEYKKGDYITDETVTQLYAIWNKGYTLTFDTNGGGEFVVGRSAYSVRRGQKYKEIMAALPVLEREGYDFLGFFYEDGTRFGSLYKIFERQEDLTVYAKWTPHKYSITFDANGGEGAPALTYKVHDARRTLSAEIPHKDGYIFLGWGLTPDAESAVYQPRGIYTLNEDVTLYAVWGIPHTLTFDARDGTMPEGYPSEVTVANGSSYATTTGLKRLPTPTREDYDFIGWFSNDGYRLSSVGTPIPFDQDTVVIASWCRAAITHNVENPLVRQYMATTDYSTDPAYEKSTLTVDSQGNDAGGFYAQSPYYRTQYTYEKDGFARSDPMPLVLKYEGIILDETYFLAVNGKEWLSTQFEIGGSKVYVNNLIPGEAYRCQLWFRKIEDGTEGSSIAPVGEVRKVIADGQVRMIRVPSDTATNGIHNVRDLGGWTTSDGSQRVKYGLVYRSTELDGTNGFGQIDEAGLALLTQLGIKNEIDLDGGTTTNGCKLPNYEKIQVVAYSAGFTHKLKGNYGTVLSRIADAAEQGEGTLFHCLAGKDRTGTVAFLLLNILGIDENQIAMDYELTFLNNNVVSKHASLVTRNEMKWGSADNPSMQSLYRDMVFYIMNDTTLEGNNLSEKVIDFAKKNLGVTDELVGRLRTVLLEDAN